MNFEENFLGHYCQEKQYPRKRNVAPWIVDRGPALPYQSMLARSVDNMDSIKKFLEKYGTEYILEYKYDGERIQINYDRFQSKGNRVKLFSRNLELCNKKYSSIVPWLDACFDTIPESHYWILDGEIVPYDYENDKILGFEQILRMKRDTQSENLLDLDHINVKIYLFDVLVESQNLLLGEDILERKRYLNKFLDRVKQPEKKFLEIVEYEIQDFTSENYPKCLQDSYQKSKDLGYEGVMIKPIGTKSKPSEYIGDNRSIWMKYKKDESEFGALDNLDLVVMGVYKGKGKRKNTFGSFLMGVYDKESGDIWPVTK